MSKKLSIVEYYPQEGHKCGYCKGLNTNHNYGLWAHSLTVQDYQSLIDRGWRRSGCYCYKPRMNMTCCPLYTIKCEALNFRISKSQKKVLKHMIKFLKNELSKNIAEKNKNQQYNIDINSEELSIYAKHFARAQQNASEINIMSVNNELINRTSVNPIETKDQTSKDSASASCSNQKQPMNSDSKNIKDKIINVTPCRKAKFLRLERKRNKLLTQGKSQNEIESILTEKKLQKQQKQQSSIQTFEELFDKVIAHKGLKKLEMKLVRVMSDEFHNTSDVSADLFKKYQMAIHNDPPEQCDRKSFFNFLVKNPLQQWTAVGGPPPGYGSFHDQYWLDNELIAVGVIDILPSCISSVYFFYDPAYSHLSLGTFSSLREIYLTRQFNEIVSDLKYYYMGFYIHTCPKMRYKAKIQPSKLLCPETYVWCNIEPSLMKLDKKKYSRLNEDTNAIDEDGNIDIEEVFVLYKKTAMPYWAYKTQRLYNDERYTMYENQEVKDYATLVGMTCARRMLLYRCS